MNTLTRSSPDDDLLIDFERELAALERPAPEHDHAVKALLEGLEGVEPDSVPVIGPSDDMTLSDDEVRELEAAEAASTARAKASAEAYEAQPATGTVTLPDRDNVAQERPEPRGRSKSVLGVRMARERELRLLHGIKEMEGCLNDEYHPAIRPTLKTGATIADLRAHFEATMATKSWLERRLSAHHSLKELHARLDRLRAHKVKDRDRKRLRAKKGPSIISLARIRLSALKTATAGKRDKSMGQLKGRESFHVRVWAIREGLRSAGTEPSLSQIARTVSRYYPEPVSKAQVQRSLATIAALETKSIWK